MACIMNRRGKLLKLVDGLWSVCMNSVWIIIIIIVKATTYGVTALSHQSLTLVHKFSQELKEDRVIASIVQIEALCYKVVVYH